MKNRAIWKDFEMEEYQDGMQREQKGRINKKMLFLFPVSFYFDRDKTYKYADLLSKMIDARYRKKGYSIYYLVFSNENIAYLEKHKDDRVIKSDVRLIDECHIPYTSNDLIQKHLGTVDELVVCGFHERDCVRKVAKHFSSIGVDTLVDIELTNQIGKYCDLPSFSIDEYNIADTLACEFAKRIHDIGYEADDGFPYDSNYTVPYYKLNVTRTKHTWQEWLQIIEQKEQKKKTPQRFQL